MIGKIIVMIRNEAGLSEVPPSNFEFGLSLDRLIAPKVAQNSPVFLGLADGVYYVWYREIGLSWDLKQVMKEVIQGINQVPNNYITYQKNANTVLLFTPDGVEIRSKLVHQPLIVNSFGQNEFVLPVEAQSGVNALLINAERYYEGTGYTLTESNTKIIWQNLFTIDVHDVVMVEYIVQLLM